MARINKLIGNIAIAKQTAQGTPAAAPTFAHPLLGGATAGFEATTKVDAETGQAYAVSAYLSEMAFGFSYDLRAYPAPIGLYLLGVLGTCVTTGTTPNYTHVFTVDPTDMGLPHHTVWGNIGTEFVKSSDAMVDSVNLSWSANDPVKITATLAALNQAFGASLPAGGTDVAGTAYFTPASGTFKVAGSGAVTAAVDVTGFDITLARNLTAEYFSGSPAPGDLSIGRFKAGVKITIKPEDLALFRTVATGTSGGTAPATSIIKGAFDVTVQIDANTSLQIVGTSVPWKCSWPSVDPSGGAVEIELSADDMLGSASVSPVTVTLKNAVASY
ncbi:MAG: hypothetical protein HGA54_01700 [Actinobacteria bacterium]|nr:hypothetical protein [Actinomycetota bacterium]